MESQTVAVSLPATHKLWGCPRTQGEGHGIRVGGAVHTEAVEEVVEIVEIVESIFHLRLIPHCVVQSAVGVGHCARAEETGCSGSQGTHGRQSRSHLGATQDSCDLLGPWTGPGAWPGRVGGESQGVAEQSWAPGGVPGQSWGPWMWQG